MEVRCDSRLIILDAGTGIRELGLALERERATEFDLLISHGHMDHIQGFPFFNPAYNPDVRGTIYMPARNGADPAEPFRRMMGDPHFPVALEELPASIKFREVNGTSQIGGVRIRTHEVNHPGRCLAFRLEYRGQVFVYLTDHEPYSRGTAGDPGENADRDRSVREFTRGADLLVRESQYTDDEYEQHRGWGHGTFDDAVTDAIEAGVKRVALFHHDPGHDDLFLERQLAGLQYRYALAPVEIFLAREGQRVELP